MKTITTYHAFTDERDDWFNTLDEAMACIKLWKSEGYSNWRIYSETSQFDGLEVDENYVCGEGEFPW